MCQIWQRTKQVMCEICRHVPITPISISGLLCLTTEGVPLIGKGMWSYDLRFLIVWESHYKAIFWKIVQKSHIFLDHIINQSFTRWNGTNFTSNSSAWVCLSIWSRMDPTLSFSKTERSEFLPEPQVGLTDIEGKKLPNGEHPAIHWNRHNKTSRIQFFSFWFSQYFTFSAGI